MKPFEHYDVINQSEFLDYQKSFEINEHTSPIIIIIRGITGSLKIKQIFSDIEYVQNIDYLDINDENRQPYFEKIKEYITPELPEVEFFNYYSNTKFNRKNFKFYSRLCTELDNFYYFQNKESYITAFVYIYRILETISYSFPLIYASKTDDFIGSYENFKSWISGNKEKGERGFFKTFIETIVKNDPLEEHTIDINIVAESDEIKSYFFNAIKRVCPEEVFNLEHTNEPNKLSINFVEFHSLIINIRNRFFHLLNSGQQNLQSDELLDSEYFFSLINKSCMNWLSLVIFEILSITIENDEC